MRIFDADPIRASRRIHDEQSAVQFYDGTSVISIDPCPNAVAQRFLAECIQLLPTRAIGAALAGEQKADIFGNPSVRLKGAAEGISRLLGVFTGASWFELTRLVSELDISENQVCSIVSRIVRTESVISQLLHLRLGDHSNTMNWTEFGGHASVVRTGKDSYLMQTNDHPTALRHETVALLNDIAELDRREVRPISCQAGESVDHRSDEEFIGDGMHQLEADPLLLTSFANRALPLLDVEKFDGLGSIVLTSNAISAGHMFSIWAGAWLNAMSAVLIERAQPRATFTRSSACLTLQLAGGFDTCLGKRWLAHSVSVSRVAENRYFVELTDASPEFVADCAAMVSLLRRSTKLGEAPLP